MIKYNVIPRKNPINKVVKYYAQMAPVNPITLNEVAEAIASNCTVTLHDCKAVLSALQEQIALNLRNGNSVRLGDLGSFHAIIKCRGASTIEDFSAGNINGLKVSFKMSSPMRYMLSKQNPGVKFQLARPGEAEEDVVEDETA
jgi:predicted histone-like DNA-binding protein